MARAIDAGNRARWRGKQGTVQAGASATQSISGRVGGVQWPNENVLSDFSNANTGEWEGTMATFDANGAAIELPHSLQTSAALEWQVFECEQPHREEWECAKTLDGVYSGALVTTTSTYFYPEVGCSFGEEVIASAERRSLFSYGTHSCCILACGAYSDGPLELPTAPNTDFEVESGVVPMHMSEDSHSEAPIKQQARLRIVHLLRTTADGQGIHLRGVRVAREVRADSELKRAHFASTKRTDLSALTSGQWQAAEGGTLALTPGPALEMVPYWGMSPRPEWSGVRSAAQVSKEEGQDSGVALTLLPCGAWSIVAQRHGMLLVEAGELAGPRLRRVCARVYTEGKFEQSIIGEDWRVDGWSTSSAIGEAPRSPEQGTREERKMVEEAYIGEYGEDGVYRLRHVREEDKVFDSDDGDGEARGNDYDSEEESGT